MKLSLVIPVYNEERYILDCLTSIFEQSEKPDEVIIVDNNSTDQTKKLIKQFPVRLLNEKKQGISHARNKGFNAAQFPIIARIDADTRLPKHWVRNVKNRFAQERSLIAYSGPTVFKDKKFNHLFAFPEKVFLASFRQMIGTDLLYGPNMAIRKKAWEKIRSSVCLRDDIVHEDLDIAIHLSGLPGKVVFDRKLTVIASERRWKQARSYIEYPYRYLRTLQHHTYLLARMRNKRVTKTITKWKNQVTSLQHVLSKTYK